MASPVALIVHFLAELHDYDSFGMPEIHWQVRLPVRISSRTLGRGHVAIFPVLCPPQARGFSMCNSEVRHEKAGHCAAQAWGVVLYGSVAMQ